MELPATTRRVSEQRSDYLNEKIWKETERRIWYFAWHPEEIEERLEELDREWDIERVLEANASGLALFGTVFGLGGRRFLLLSAVVSGFLLQHALQGWCPPVTLLRRLGLRTQTEIEAERYALKALRGDFREIGETVGDQRAEDQPAGRVVRAIEH